MKGKKNEKKDENPTNLTNSRNSKRIQGTVKKRKLELKKNKVTFFFIYTLVSLGLHI